MAGDIIYFSVAGPVGYYTGAHTVIFRGVFPLYYSPEGRAKLRWALIGQVGRGALYFLGCRKAYKGAMDGARGGEYYTVYQSLCCTVKRYTPLSAASLI